jgi:hypothetical protein
LFSFDQLCAVVFHEADLQANLQAELQADLHTIENPRETLEGAKGIFKNIEFLPKGPRFREGDNDFWGVPSTTNFQRRRTNARTGSADPSGTIDDRLWNNGQKNYSPTVHSQWSFRLSKNVPEGPH